MYCFNKYRRLSKKKDYKNVFSNSNIIKTTEFMFFYIKNNFLFSRLGLIISKKSIKKSNERNRIKRLIRETFRIAILPAFDIIVVSRKSNLENLENNIIVLILERIWKKLSTL